MSISTDAAAFFVRQISARAHPALMTPEQALEFYDELLNDLQSARDALKEEMAAEEEENEQ